MDFNKIKIGMKIYYRGDMLNQEGFGEITEKIENTWGTFFSTKLNDGREQKRVPSTMLSDIDTENGHTRFYTLDAYVDLQKEYKKILFYLRENESTEK